MTAITNHSPKNIIVVNEDTQYKKPRKRDYVKSYFAGGAAQGVASAAVCLPSLLVVDKMTKVAEGANSDVIKNALNQALDISGMTKKGVKLVDYADKPPIKPYDFLPKKWPEKLKEFIRLNVDPLYATSKGKNAFFVAENPLMHNQIHINTKKLGVAGFHEIGHAINYNTSKFLRGIQKARMPLMAAAALLPMIAICKRPKAEGEQPKGFFDKATTFIKNNVGKLSFAAMLPIVAEEAIATMRGNKLAKQLLSPENFKKVAKCNMYGGATYVLSAVAMGVGAWAANKVADKFLAPKKMEYTVA